MSLPDSSKKMGPFSARPLARDNWTFHAKNGPHRPHGKV
jgi:hypothetical protein